MNTNVKFMLRIFLKIPVGPETNRKLRSKSGYDKIVPDPQHWKKSGDGFK
jgi:hypothetical protein